MSLTSVLCIATSPAQTDYIVNQLRARDFPSRDISIVLAKARFAGSNRSLEAAKCGHPDGCGWIGGLSALLIPETGPFAAAGPIIAAVCGAENAAGAGGVAGGLMSLGIAPDHAELMESRIRKGSFLISVHTGDSSQRARATSLFARAGAQHLCCAGAALIPQARRTRAASHARPMVAAYGA